MNPLVSKIQRVFEKLDELRWLWLLVARLGVGGEFLLSGWGKLHRLDKLIAYFTELKIPAPSLQAPFIATLEFVGGLLLIVGLGTRLFGFLLSCTMVVAMLTAVDFHDKGLADFLYLSEWLLLLLLSSFVFSGGGKASVDALAARRMKPEGK
jgi:putative oxidoreductase